MSIADDVQAISRMAAVPTLLEVVARTTGMRFTAIARVTDQKWIACAVRDEINFGLVPGGELQLETTICNEIRQHRRPVIFGDAREHAEFCDHATPRLYGFKSYVSIPILRASGEFFGTLCAIDPMPAKLDDPTLLKTLELFAQLISANLEADEQLQRSQSLLASAVDTAMLRDQFIAVLGHDLNNPLHAVSMATQVLEKVLEQPRERMLVATVRRSVSRMSELIENVLDFARGKLGGGIPAQLSPSDQLGAVLSQVIAEVQLGHPQRRIEVAIDLPEPVVCDTHRLGQLFGNLLQNAMVHGAADQAVRVVARQDNRYFELAVSNGGPPIPSATLSQLFEPFTRASPDSASGKGLGLGLYIAAQIARAHRGELTVTSVADQTCFRLRMPRAAVQMPA